jgi:hypothetical protein
MAGSEEKKRRQPACKYPAENGAHAHARGSTVKPWKEVAPKMLSQIIKIGLRSVLTIRNAKARLGAS